MRSDRVGNYRVIERIGEGGMGAVYRGEHAILGRPVAIKVLLPELSHSQEMVGRFFNEARATAQLNHPGIVDVFDFGYTEDDHAAFIVMELLNGQSLKQRLASVGRLRWQGAIDCARQIALALAAAHRGRIVHRDLKPDNIFLVHDPETGERVKVLDFGIAKLAAGPTGDASVKTRAGTLMGTPTYMSPQQCRGVEVDHRADIYSLGCILFEMVCGRPPFVGEGMGDLLHSHMMVAPPAPSQFAPEIPPAFEATILRALAKSETERQQTMEELVAELDGVAANPGAAFTATLRPNTFTSGIMAPSTTTLSSSSGQLAVAGPAPTTVRPAPNRRLLFALLAGATLVGAVVAIAVVAGGHKEPSEPAAVPVAVVQPPPVVPTEPPAPPKRKPKLAVVQLTDAELAEQAAQPKPVKSGATDPTGKATVGAETEDSQNLSGLMEMSADSSLLLWALGGDDYLVKSLGPNAALSIASKPSGASITYDGVVIGKTPMSIALERGAYNIDVDLALPGYADRSVSISAATDHVTTITLPQLIHLRVVSKPAGADVLANGEVVGKTPLELQLPPSDQPQQLTLKLSGYLDKIVEITPTKNGTTTFPLEREPQPVVHEIDSLPPGVDVVLAGAVVGKTPFRVEFLEEKGKSRDYILKAPANEPRFRDTLVHVAADKSFKRQIHLRDICSGRAAEVDRGAPTLVNPYDPCRAK